MIKKNTLFKCCYSFVLSITCAQVYGESENLVSFTQGTIPVLITAPHGGSSQPDNVSIRTGTNMQGVTVEDFNTVKDSWTKGIAQDIQAKYEQKYGGIPYIVTAEFHRKYIDANRPEHQAYESQAAQLYYDSYQSKVVEYIKEIKQKFGKGVLLDIHGQAQQPDKIIRGTRNGISVQNLVAEHGWDSIVGGNGFFGLLSQQGFTVEPENSHIPTTSDPTPEGALSGGTTLKHNGSHNLLGLDAIQFEIGSNIRFSESQREYFSDNMADNINTFMTNYFCNDNVATFPCSPAAVLIDFDYKGYYESNDWSNSGAVDNFPSKGLSKSRYTNSEGENTSWSTTVDQTGTYHVYAWWTNTKSSGSSYNRDGSAEYVISTGTNNLVVTKDQNSIGGQWVSLAAMQVQKGETIKVSLTREHDGDEGSATVADAMKVIWGGIQ